MLSDIKVDSFQEMCYNLSGIGIEGHQLYIEAQHSYIVEEASGAHYFIGVQVLPEGSPVNLADYDSPQVLTLTQEQVTEIKKLLCLNSPNPTSYEPLEQ